LPGSIDPKRLIVVVVVAIAAAVVIAASIVFETIVAPVTITVTTMAELVIAVLTKAILGARVMVAEPTAIAHVTIDCALEASQIALDLIGFLTVQPAIRSPAETVLKHIDRTIEAQEFAPRQLTALAEAVNALVKPIDPHFIGACNAAVALIAIAVPLRNGLRPLRRCRSDSRNRRDQDGGGN